MLTFSIASAQLMFLLTQRLCGGTCVHSQGLSNYDGSTERSAIRCLESLFKAISNLSLYTPNIQPFLDAGEPLSSDFSNILPVLVFGRRNSLLVMCPALIALQELRMPTARG